MVLNTLHFFFLLKNYVLWILFFLHFRQCWIISFNTFPFDNFSIPFFGFSESGTLITLVLDSLCSISLSFSSLFFVIIQAFPLCH